VLRTVFCQAGSTPHPRIQRLSSDKNADVRDLKGGIALDLLRENCNFEGSPRIA
jgi:hypothetical protein